MPELSAPVAGVPAGCIVMWSGLLVNIPDGWALCDGTLGTPDLRDRFICGAAALAEPGAVGGGNSHSHVGSAASAGAHTHTTVPHAHSMGRAEVRLGPDEADIRVTGRVGTNPAQFDAPHIGRNSTSWRAVSASTQTQAFVVAYLQTQDQDTASASPGVNSGGAHTHTTSTDTVDHRPRFFALAFIMKL